MNKVELQNIVGGALQEKFEKAFEKVVENMQDANTSFRIKRGINIKLSFSQNEMRDEVLCDIDVVEKLAPQAAMRTQFAVGKDLRTGELYAEEFGKQIKGQMSINDYVDEEPKKSEPKVEEVNGKKVDTETGEIVTDNVVDFRKAAL